MKVVVKDAALAVHWDSFLAALPPEAEAHLATTDAEAAELITDAEVFVGSTLPRELAGRATRLRLIHAVGAGLDGIHRTALAEHVLTANTFHHESSIAEHIAAALVMLRRGILHQDARLRVGQWSSPIYDSALAQPRTLRGSTVTFLGFGHIGQAAWQLLRAFGMHGRAVTRTGSVDAATFGLEGAAPLSALREHLEASDVLVVSIPLDDTSRGSIGARQLDLLGPDGLLVNVARGPIVNETDLYTALRDRRIAGAVLDVWYRYPGPDGHGLPATEPFGALPNVVLTPHSSGVTADTFLGRISDIGENITRLVQRRPLKNLVEIS